MIPHHEQAVEMAKLAKQHASTAEVKKLADKIAGAQGPEIDTMKGWLKDWDQSGSDGSMSGMGDSSGSAAEMQGMMSDAQMSALSSSAGADFDQMFLTMMVAHHTGAIEMAKTEQAKGKNADAKELAKKIEAGQTAELVEMKQLLSTQ